MTRCRLLKQSSQAAAPPSPIGMRRGVVVCQPPRLTRVMSKVDVQHSAVTLVTADSRSFGQCIGLPL